MEWPLVATNDDGIRPAGKPDECFYCRQKIGDRHRHDCVIVTKKVRLRYIFTIEADVPHHWTKQNILFHRNDSSWCADNALGEIEEISDKIACLCGVFECEFVGVVDDTPKRELATHQAVAEE